MTPERERQLADYALGGLSDEEADDLARAAVADPELFEELAAAVPIRDITQDPRTRSELLEALEAPPSWWAWSWRPVLIWAGLGAVLVCGWWASIRLSPKQEVASGGDATVEVSGLHVTGASESLDVANIERLLAIPVSNPAGFRGSLDKPGTLPEYRIGDDLRVSVSSPPAASECRIVVLDVETRSVIHPLAGRGHPLAGGQTFVAPPVGAPRRLVTPPFGQRTVRVIAIPAGPEADSRNTQVIELRYVVVE